MGAHQRHAHDHVFRGEAAREQLRIRKRDSHGDSIRMHVPEGFERKQTQDDESEEAASVVYVTLAQTFDGPAVYSTLAGDYTPQVTQAVQTEDGSPNFYTGTPNAASRTAAGDDPVETSTFVPQASNTDVQKTTFATETATPTGGSVVAGTPIQGTRPTSATAASQDGEMSGGAKAGLAFGIILAIGLVVGLCFFAWRKKRGGKQEEALNEKRGSFADVGARRAEANGAPGGMSGGMLAAGVVAGGAAAGAAAAANRRDSSITEKVPSSLRSTHSASTAPRLSLRPVTQFLPMLGDNKSSSTVNHAEKHNSASNGSDPFADAPVLSEKEARAGSPPANPFDEQRRSNETSSVVASAAVVAAAATHAGGHGHSPKASWEGSEPATPKSAHFGTAAAVPIAAGAAGAPPPRQPNNVHRVQLDFKPSMDDELELVSGALVRLLHEYDDGWALCISMDRSKQGVAPRTCLSKLPVKPRPQGPPPPQGSRGPPRAPPPPQGARRPSDPPALNGAPGAMQPRPLTPQSVRTPSPTEQRPVEQPSTSEATSTSPAAVQVPTRKPVPGQAM